MSEKKMECFDARVALWPPERLRVATEETLLAKNHVASCGECQAYFDQDPFVLSTYEALRNEQAPTVLREKVFDILASERAAQRVQASGVAVAGGFGAKNAAKGFWTLGGVAMAVVAIGGVALLNDPATEGAPETFESEEGAAFVEDYVRRAVGADKIESSDPNEISGFLVRELGISHTPLALGDLALSGVEVCYLGGRRGAMIVYEEEGRMVSHYLIPKDGVEPRDPAPAPNRDGVEAPSVVTWASPALEQALVGSFTSDELLEMIQASR